MVDGQAAFIEGGGLVLYILVMMPGLAWYAVALTFRWVALQCL